MVRIRKPYDPPVQVGLDCSQDLSATKQSFKDECDINRILHGYRKTGLIDHLSKHQGIYDDVSNYDDYHASMNLIIESQESFNALPSEIRKRFSNDPSLFLDFVHDESNRAEMIEMGLIKKPADPGAGLAPVPGVAAPSPSGSSGEGE